jgi:hypothetical protein
MPKIKKKIRPHYEDLQVNSVDNCNIKITNIDHLDDLTWKFMYFYCYDYVFSLYVYVWLNWLRFFPCFFLGCKANVRAKPENTGHGPHSFYFLCCSMYFLCCSMYLLCCSMYSLCCSMYFLCRSMYFLCCSMYFCVVLCIFCVLLCVFVLFYVFLCCSAYFLCCSMYFCVVCIFCVVLCIFVLFYAFFCCVTFSVLFVCICVLYYCHRVATQLQLKNTSHHKFCGRK